MKECYMLIHLLHPICVTERFLWRLVGKSPPLLSFVSNNLFNYAISSYTQLTMLVHYVFFIATS